MSSHDVQQERALLERQQRLRREEESLKNLIAQFERERATLDEEKRQYEQDVKLLKKRVERLDKLETSLVERSALLRTEQRRVRDVDRQLRQRELKVEDCCVNLEKEREKVKALEKRCRHDFPTIQKRIEELSALEEAFMKRLDDRAREDERLRKTAQQRHAFFLKKREEEANERLATLQKMISERAQEDERKRRHAQQRHLELLKKKEKDADDRMAALQRLILDREQALKASQQKHRGDIATTRHAILNEAQLAVRLDSLIRDSSIFTGRISYTNPNGKSMEQLFWTDGGHATDEILLFHGTDSLSRRQLQAKGVKVDVARNIAYGQGFYLTPDPREAISYAETRFRQRHPTTLCMSPVLIVYKIQRGEMGRWTFPNDFNMKWTSPYYVIIKNQEMTGDLEHVATWFLEERCRAR